MTGWRILEALHGHAAVLAAAALAHPAILLRKGAPMSFRTRLAVALTVGVVALAFASGLVIYATYVDRVRVQLFLRNPSAGLLFETKEHLAFAVTAITLGAGVAAWFAPAPDRALRRAAALAFGVAAILCLVTSGLGTYIAGVHGFGGVR
ncbi:MAG: hypothetical protein FJ096_06805 [Deltaproteobacteria bacterium]|nr:hypothetical protein [Deltaproteobacteria bacterium]